MKKFSTKLHEITEICTRVSGSILFSALELISKRKQKPKSVIHTQKHTKTVYKTSPHYSDEVKKVNKPVKTADEPIKDIIPEDIPGNVSVTTVSETSETLNESAADESISAEIVPATDTDVSDNTYTSETEEYYTVEAIERLIKDDLHLKLNSYRDINEHTFKAETINLISENHSAVIDFLRFIRYNDIMHQSKIKYKINYKKHGQLIAQVAEHLCQEGILSNVKTNNNNIMASLNQYRNFKYIYGEYLEDYICVEAQTTLEEISDIYHINYVIVKNACLSEEITPGIYKAEIDCVFAVKTSENVEHLFFLEAKDCCDRFLEIDNLTKKFDNLQIDKENCIALIPVLNNVNYENSSYAFHVVSEPSKLKEVIRETVISALSSANVTSKKTTPKKAVKPAYNRDFAQREEKSIYDRDFAQRDDLESFNYVKKLKTETKIITIPKMQLKMQAFEWGRDKLKAKGYREAASKIMLLHPNYLDKLYVDYIKNNLLVGFNENLEKLDAYEKKEYEINMLMKLADAFKYVSEECWNEIYELNGTYKPNGEDYRSLYIRGRLNLRPKNYKERKAQSASHRK